MSPGFSPEDFRTIGERSWKVYRACCRGAPSEFQEIAAELLSLYAVLKLLQDFSENSKSLVSRAADSWKLEVSEILRLSRRTLNAIDNLVTKYHSLGIDKERIWYTGNKDELEPLRKNLKLSVSNLTKCLDSLETSSLATIEFPMEKLLQDIRAGRRTSSVLSSVIDNAAVGWPQLKTELAGVGIPKADIEMFKEPIQEWIREAGEEGIFEEIELSEDTAPRRVHLRRLSFRAPPSSIHSVGEVMTPQHATQQPASTEEDGTDEDGFESSKLSVGGVIVLQPTSPTAEHPASTEGDEAGILEVSRSISFSDPVPLLPLSLPPFSTESSEAIESTLAAADKTGPIMPEPYAKVEPHVASSTTKAVSEILGEVMSHAAPPESPISPQREINFVAEEPSENAPHAKGYVSPDSMSSSRHDPNNQPSSDSRFFSQAGREVPSQGFLSACLGRCKDNPYDTRYLIEEEIKTLR